MSVFQDFHFLRPYWLLLILAAIIVWWLLRKLNDPLRGWRNLIEPELLRALTVGSQNKMYPSVILGTIWILGVLAIAGPTWHAAKSPFADNPIPVMVVMSADESLNTTDLSPSRLERARLKVVDIATAKRGQPLGLIAYAGTPHLVLPPTRDTSIVSKMAVELAPEIMPKKGNDLAAALTLAQETLGEQGGSIIVVTDRLVDQGNDLNELLGSKRYPVHILAVAKSDSPQITAMNQITSSAHVDVVQITADSSDIDSLIYKTSSNYVSATTGDDTIRWEDSGYWLVPILALLQLVGFRRVKNKSETATP